MNNSELNHEEFYEAICRLPEKYADRNLEEYLLALHGLILPKQNEPVSLSLFLELFESAFTAEAYPFNFEWLSITEEPEEDKPGNPFEYTLAVIRFQVAELFKMRGKQLIDEMRYMGIESETGVWWSNFDPFTNLECAARWVLDGPGETLPITWATPGVLLEAGRSYE
jgi:hypothetical protein